jgi:hypothetical protein
MENAKDLDRILAHAISNDVRRPRDHHFAGAKDSPGPPTAGKIHQCLDSFKDSTGDDRRGARVIFGYVGAQVFEIVES